MSNIFLKPEGYMNGLKQNERFNLYKLKAFVEYMAIMLLINNVVSIVELNMKTGVPTTIIKSLYNRNLNVKYTFYFRNKCYAYF